MNLNDMAITTSDAFEAHYVKPKAGLTLIVGSKVYATRQDRRSRYRKALGVDLLPGQGVDRVVDLEEKLPDGLGPFAHIDCVSVLEHAKRPWLLAANLMQLLEKMGTLYVQVPFVWRVHAYPSDYWRFTIDGLLQLFPRVDWIKLQYIYECKTQSLPKLHYNDLVYLGRTQICGFGVKA